MLIHQGSCIFFRLASHRDKSGENQNNRQTNKPERSLEWTHLSLEFLEAGEGKTRIPTIKLSVMPPHLRPPRNGPFLLRIQFSLEVQRKGRRLCEGRVGVKGELCLVLNLEVWGGIPDSKYLSGWVQ